MKLFIYHFCSIFSVSQVNAEFSRDAQGILTQQSSFHRERYVAGAHRELPRAVTQLQRLRQSSSWRLLLGPSFTFHWW